MMASTKRPVFEVRQLHTNMGNLDRAAIKSHKRSVSFSFQQQLAYGYIENVPQRSISVEMSVGVSPSDVSTPVILSPTANPGDQELLAKLNAANREYEQDQKSLSSLTPPKTTGGGSISSRGHSRQASLSSIASNVSQCSNASNFEYEPGNAEELWNLWSRIISDWENVNKRKHQYVKELVRHGIPHHFRGIVWQLLCSAHNDDSKGLYADYLKQTSPMEKMIRRDITRTYPEHAFFKEKNGLGQESLFNVMKAYSLHDREVGYCQGSGFIVGLLLMQMPEEEAFAVLVKLMQDYNMRDLFKPSMAELGVCMYQLEHVIQELLPQLHAHFQAQSFSVSMFASSWFLTVFTTTFTATVVCRIFDVFLMEGTDYIFRVAISILQICEAHLLTLDMEGMIKFLSKDGIQAAFVDAEQLVNTSVTVKYSSKKLKKLEKEYNTLKSKEKEEEVELRRLRTENRLLRQRIDNLEKETATLADRLIHDQVKCAQNQETILGLRKDLSLARQYGADCTHRLEEMQEQYEQIKRCSSASSQASLETSLPEADQNRMQRLQAENKELKEKESEHMQTIKQQNTRIKELENANIQLSTEPSTQLMTIQEELIACKLREAEANLSLKELQQKVFDLDKHWQRNMEKLNTSSPNAKVSKTDLRHMTDEVMSLRLKEAQAISQLNDSKQQLMELETKNHISARQNKRLDKEKISLEEKLDTQVAHEKTLQNTIQELERKVSNLESKRKEDEMMVRIRDAEHSQLVADMRRRVAELEIENQELVTEGQLVERGEKGTLQNQIADLQDEVLQLKMGNDISPVTSPSKYNSITGETESDYESDDLEMTMSANKLCLTESMCGIELQNALSGTSSTSMSRPNNLPSRTNQADSSDTDTAENSSSNNNSHLKQMRTRRKKRHSHGSRKMISKDGIDLDKTPTQDSIDTQCFLVQSNQLNDIDTPNNRLYQDLLRDGNSVDSDDHPTCDMSLLSNSCETNSSSAIKVASSSDDNSSKNCADQFDNLHHQGQSYVTRPKDFHVNHTINNGGSVCNKSSSNKITADDCDLVNSET